MSLGRQDQVHRHRDHDDRSRRLLIAGNEGRRLHEGGRGHKGGGVRRASAYAEAADNAQGELYMKFAEMDRRQLLCRGGRPLTGAASPVHRLRGDNRQRRLVDLGADPEEYCLTLTTEGPCVSRIKKKIIKMKALPFLKDKDPIMYVSG